MSSAPTLTWQQYQKLPPEKRQRPLTPAEYAALNPTQRGNLGLDEAQQGVPADFSGPVFANPDQVQPQLDSDPAVPVTRLPNGVSFQQGNWKGKTPGDVSNPAPAEILPPAIRTVGAKMSAAPQIDFSKYENQPAASGTSPQIDFSKYEGQQGAQQPRTWEDSVGDFGSALWKQINPIAGVEGAAQMVNHPIDTFKNDADARQQVYNEAEKAFKNKDYVGGAAHLLYSVLPLIGPQLDAAGNDFAAGNYAKGAGASTGMGLALAGPEAIKGINLKLPTAELPETLYKSALKPSTTMPTGEVGRVVNTALENNIPVSAEGMDRLNSLVNNLSDTVKSQIQSGSQAGATVDPAAIAQRADALKNRFANQVAPNADLQAIENTKQEFLQNNPNPIPAADAQSMKQGTYQQLKARAYGEQGSATVEAQKALARGIKEELETQFPEIKDLNAQQGNLMSLDAPLERAVRRIDNHQLIGLGTPVMATAGAAVGGAPGAAVAGLLKMIVDQPEFKSKLAIKLYDAGKGTVPMSAINARLASYSNALGNATNNQAPSGNQAQ